MKNMFKKALSVLVAAILVFGAMPLAGIDFSDIAKLFPIKAIAASVDVNSTGVNIGDYTYYKMSKTDDEGEQIYHGIRLIKYIGNATVVEIPSEIEGLPVTIIHQECFRADSSDSGEFSACANIEKVIIPESVIKIEKNAFRNCTSLKAVEFKGNGLEEIGDRAFLNTALAEFNPPDSLIKIGQYAFQDTEITEIIFGKNEGTYFYVSDYAFGNSKIKNVGFESNNVRIRMTSFGKSVVENVGFTGSVESFESGLSKDENPVINIVFSSDVPAEALNMLCTEYGYTYYVGGGVRYLTMTGGDNDPYYKTDEYTYILKENGDAHITGYFGISGDVEVPSEIDGHPVTAIIMNAFQKFVSVNPETTANIYLTSVSIPSTVKLLGAYAFADNSNLKTVNLPEGLEEIGISVFRNCTSLDSLNIPDSVKKIGETAFENTGIKSFTANGVREIGYGAFMNCAELKTVDLSDTMESIGKGAFAFCSSLTEITVPEGITRIEVSVFDECKALQSVYLPESISFIGEYAFNECVSLKSMTNTKYIETVSENSFFNVALTEFDFSSLKGEIPMHAFYHCMIKNIVIPGTVTAIGTYAFRDSYVESLTVENGVTSLGVGAFMDCPKLAYVSLPDSVEIIPKEAFRKAPITDLRLSSKLKKIDKMAFYSGIKANEVTLPETLEVIGENAFSYGLIKSLNFNAENCVYEFENTYFVNDKTPFYYCNVININLAKNIDAIPDYFLLGSTIHNLVIPDTVKKIGTKSFYGCTYLKTVTLPDTLEHLGNAAFQNCYELEEFTYPKGLKTAYRNAIYGCKELVRINYHSETCVFENTGSPISGYDFYTTPFAFKNLNGVVYGTLVIGEGVKTIPDGLCAELKGVEVTIPSTVKDIGVGSFYQCEFKNLVLPEGLESIDSYAFAKNQNLTSVSLPSSLRIIDNSAFSGCNLLESIEIPESVIYLGDEIFMGCLSLKSAVFACSINTIPARTFNLCRALEEIYISDSVVRIGEDAFASCTKLVSVRMSPNVTYLPDNTFYDCRLLTTFTWDSDSKLIGRLTFGNCVSLKEFNFIGIEKLYENSFYNSGISVVTLGEAKNEENAKLKEIEAQSFMDCASLEELVIGGDVSTVKSRAFANCESLETALISDSVTEIAPDAFDGCENLTICCNENSYAYSYATAQGIPVSTFVIAAIPNQEYSGKKIEPDVSVSLSGKALKDNVDFGVTYANNINVGLADVNVRGKGVYKMFASRANFTIVTKNISALTVMPVSEQDYTGEAVIPVITVSNGNIVLTEGVDYKAEYSDNVNEGTAKIKITGIGNYSGTLEATFEIKEQTPAQSIFGRILTFFTSLFARIVSFFSKLFA